MVYTVKNGEYPVIDESLLNDIPPDTEILRRKIWEPYNLYKKFTGQTAEVKISPGFLAEDKKTRIQPKNIALDTGQHVHTRCKKILDKTLDRISKKIFTE